MLFIEKKKKKKTGLVFLPLFTMKWGEIDRF